MHIVLIRHGETALNKENRLQGSKGPNEGLTPAGVAMVERLRDELMIDPDAMYVSPLRRARETAEILNGRFRVPIVLVPQIVERDFGSLSGRLRSEVDPKLVELDLEGRYDYRPFGGESVDDVRARVLSFLSTLPLSSDRTVFMVTHRGIVRLMYDLFPGMAAGEEVLPASKHAFEIDALPEG